MGKYFGTDGVRGVANVELTNELAYKIAKATVVVLTKNSVERPKILIGKDTRISSDMLESALVAGFLSMGANVELLGVVPTPAVAYLTRKYNANASVMISASHNPAEYNGIKIFDSKGYKLPDEVEYAIEEIIDDNNFIFDEKSGADLGTRINNYNSVRDYVDFAVSTVDENFSNFKIAIDCANGSASATARDIFKKLGARTVIINSNPNGVNINDNCGSTSLGAIKTAVKESSCDIGIAFDGDADRCLAVDENGEVIDGDKMIAIFAKFLKEEGKLVNDTAVVTTLSNLGFFKMAKENDINVEVTDVGDRYVLERMLSGDYIIGGEQSGHIIFLNHNTTGDGQISALQLINILKKSEVKASELASIMDKYPQVMINVRVSNDKKNTWSDNSKIMESIKKAEDILGDEGRILIRASGTENLVRVMAEGKDFKEINTLCANIADIIKEQIG